MTGPVTAPQSGSTTSPACANCLAAIALIGHRVMDRIDACVIAISNREPGAKPRTPSGGSSWPFVTYGRSTDS